MPSKHPKMDDIRVTRKRMELLITSCKADLELDLSDAHKMAIHNLMAAGAALQSKVSQTEYTIRAEKLQSDF
ncbi:MAG: hypothetical protein JKY67_00270 [Pseudomonadales bacterium]|nr:hypothetical protein [Pseudomonadales bacterium]